MRSQDGRDVVFVAQNGRAERRAVAVNSVAGEEAVIGGGVASGEKVITDSPTGLADGVKVREAKQ